MEIKPFKPCPDYLRPSRAVKQAIYSELERSKRALTKDDLMCIFNGVFSMDEILKALSEIVFSNNNHCDLFFRNQELHFLYRA